MSDAVVVFSVRVFEDGSKTPGFDSELRLPLPRTPEEQVRAIERWLDLMSSGLRINASDITATLE